jgi:hypothetical protein
VVLLWQYILWKESLKMIVYNSTNINKTKVLPITSIHWTQKRPHDVTMEIQVRHKTGLNSVLSVCHKILWRTTNNSSNIDRLLKLQKRTARIILNVSEITTPSSILFQNLKWMPINDYFVYRKCILIYKVLNNLTPEYLNVFQYVSQVSSRITRIL